MPIPQNTGVVPVRLGGRDGVRADQRCSHARLTPDGITQRCVLDHNHEGPHLDQSVQRVWWAADSDVGQPAGEPPVSDREPTDDVELVDPATARRRYYAKVSGIVEEYQRVARLNQSRNDWLQWLVIGFSAGTTALAGVAAAVADWRVRIVPKVTSAVGTIAAGLTAYPSMGRRGSASSGSSPRRKLSASVRWSWSSHQRSQVTNHPARPVPASRVR